jgi:hypothetical protein
MLKKMGGKKIGTSMSIFTPNNEAIANGNTIDKIVII